MASPLSLFGRAERRLRYLIAVTFLALCVVVGIGLPGLMFADQWLDQSELLDLRLSFVQRSVSALISTTPDLWQFQLNRLEEVFQRDIPATSNIAYRLIDSQGAVVLADGAARTGLIKIIRRYPVFQGLTTVGHIEAQLDLDSKLAVSMTMAAFGFASAFLFLLALRIIGLRVLRRVLSSLEAAQLEAERQVVEISEARQSAEAASRSKTIFVAALSHELRSPLNAILGFSQLIRDQHLGADGTPAYAEYGAVIHEAAEHLIRIFNDILDLAKIEAGRMELEIQWFDLGAVCRSVVRLFSEQSERKNLKVSVDLSDQPCSVQADARGIKQVLINLVSNAIKFTGPGGEIRIGGTALGDGGGRLTVSDTGCGIAPSQIEKLMLPFEQADNQIGRAAGGSGLGLALVKGLAELHGGSIAISSQSGMGTTITVTWPGTRGPR